MHKHMGKFIQKFEFFIDFWIHPSHAMPTQRIFTPYKAQPPWSS